MDVLLVVVVALVMIVGVVGTVLPFVPGLPLVLLAGVGYGLIAGFGSVGWVCLALMGVLFGLGAGAGILLPKRRLDEVGAPRSTMLVGISLGVIGFFVVPVVGLPLGAAVGVWLAERSRLGDPAAAWRSTRSLLLGFGAGALVQMGAGVAMMLVWGAWVVTG